ncbi:hypothetical protein [uncultured Microscilla sp.]|uniref:hypothetical protein n=1 Tax=uncultured Microscilla sp. TaxID=432653 RepID=UPI002630B938|nr:hypothetical protein [uncultured Microscilla sp.]
MKKVLLFAFISLFFCGFAQAQLTKTEVEAYMKPLNLQQVKTIYLTYNTNQKMVSNAWSDNGYEYPTVASLQIKYTANAMLLTVNQRAYLIPYKAIKLLRYRKKNQGMELIVMLFD